MIKLHLGCGKRDFGNGWSHIDGGDYPHVCAHDITKLDFPDNYVDLIYASHVIEYFDRVEVMEALNEWFRVLKYGGTLRLAMPDFEVMARLYTTDKIAYPLKSLLGPLYGKMKMNGENIYHKTCYDFENLSEILQLTGFKYVNRYDWRKTEHAQFDDHSQAYLNKNLISLNVEAIK